MDIAATVSADIAEYIATTKKSAQVYDADERQAIERFLAQVQSRDYLQAELVVYGYLLCGGTAISAITPVARAIQMTHTYAAMLTDKYDVAALHGLHAAEIIIANADFDEDVRIKAVSITNRALLLFTHALSHTKPTEHTAHCYATELTLNPLHVGMVLAGADCNATDAITPFALAWGRALRSGLNDDKQAARQALHEVSMWSAHELDPLAKRFAISIK